MQERYEGLYDHVLNVRGYCCVNSQDLLVTQVGQHSSSSTTIGTWPSGHSSHIVSLHTMLPEPWFFFHRKRIYLKNQFFDFIDLFVLMRQQLNWKVQISTVRMAARNERSQS